MIELCEERGVHIYVTTHDRLYDPSNARDRASLIDEANKAEYASAETSQRTKRAARRQARKGRPHGQCNLGYMRRYHPQTGRLVEQVRDPAKAPLIEELFARLDRGGTKNSLRSIFADWKRQGIRNERGTPYSTEHLRILALTPAYAGLRIHIAGNKSGTRKVDPSKVVKAQWEGLVKEDVFWRVYRKLTDPTRRTYVSGRTRHLLSYTARCDVCGGGLNGIDRPRYPKGIEKTPEIRAAAKADAKPEYRCHDHGCVTVSRPELDEVAERAVLAFLADPANVERLTAEESGGGERVAGARTEVEKICTELLSLAHEVGAGRVSPALAAVAEPGIKDRLADAERRLTDLSMPGSLRGLLAPGEDVVQRWARSDLSTKREILRIVLRPNVLGQLRVARKPGRGRSYCHAKDRIVWLVDEPGES